MKHFGKSRHPELAAHSCGGIGSDVAAVYDRCGLHSIFSAVIDRRYREQIEP